MLIRTIGPNDADQLVRLKLQLDDETQFMMFEPGERIITVEEQRKQIEHTLSQDNQTILVAEYGGQLVGYLSALGGKFKRNRHSVYIVVGILQAFTGQGIGTQLFLAMEEWACQHQLHRLELTVMTHNQAGLALYKKRGFEIEGVRKHAIFVNGQYVDEYAMAKLLYCVASS
jgi:RimJ/RimL family protein N-acetyltransferase